MKSATVLVLFAATAALSAQGSPQTTFRGGVDLVAVDFIAATADGRPIADLRPADVTLTVDGRTREIRDLQFIRLAAEDRTERTAVAPSAPVPIPFSSNRAGETGRTVVFLFDDNSIRPGNEGPARDAAIRFLGRLSAVDRVAVATGSRVVVDLTTNRERVRAAIAGVVGYGAGGTAGIADKSATTRPTGTAIQQAGPTLAWLRVFLESLKDIDGPKTVILVAEGTPPITSGGTPDPSIAADYKEIGKAAGAAHAQLYMIQPYNFPIDASQTSGDVGRTSTSTVGYLSTEQAKFEGLQDLATVSGGELFRLSSGADEVFEHIVRQSSAYYLLGFVPETSERNGKSHRIAVSVSRPGVNVRARPEFTIPKADAAEAARKLSLPEMLKSRTTFRDLPLRAAAYTVRNGTSGRVNVVVVAESLDGSIPLGTVAFGLTDTNFNLMTLAWPAEATAITETRAVSGGAVPPGPYRLRVAALSRDGRRGTADYEFVAALAKAPPLELGDLMIGQGQPDGTFRPELIVGDRAAATGYFEMQGALPVGTALSATFELANAPDAAPLATVPGIVLPTETPGRLSARGAIPIGSFPPGDYIVRAIVKVDGVVIGRVLRVLRKRLG